MRSYTNRFEVKMDKFEGNEKIWIKESYPERESYRALHKVKTGGGSLK